MSAKNLAARCISGLFCFHVKRLDSGFLTLQISVRSNDEQRFSIFLHPSDVLSFALPPSPSLSQSSLTLKSPPIIAPRRDQFRPKGEIPRRHTSNSLILRKVLTDEIYSPYTRKISICLNRRREESVGSDDVSIVCARKYEMVRMT